MDTNGVLAVYAKNPATGDESHEVFERSARFVSQQEIARLKKEAKAYKEADMLQIRRHSTRNNLLATCLLLKYYLFTDEDLTSLDKATKDEIERRCQEVEDRAKMHPDKSSETYKGKKQELIKDWNMLRAKKDKRSAGLQIELNKKNL